MKVMIIYRDRSDHAREVYEFIEVVRRRYPDKKIEQLDIDTRDGATKAKMYGVVRYPAVIATASNGSVQSMWEGLPLPLIDEVVGLLVEQ